MEWLPEDHLARFIMDVVSQLDLSAIYRHYERELRGFPPHHPQMMVGLLLYAYCVGVPSSRKIERRTYEDVAFRVIAANEHPDHSRISDFRRVHLKALAGLFVQVLKLCRAAGLVRLGHVSLDGTKVKANASKHKAMSYDRMKKDEGRLKEKIDQLLRQAEQTDAAEDRLYGRGKRGDELPEDLRRSQDRLERIRALKAELEAEACEQQSQRDDSDDDGADPPPPSETLPTHKIPVEKDGTPTDKAQRNFTDPESRIMKMSDGFVQAYNCQAVVDAENQIIVGQDVSNQPPDVEYLQPLMEQTIVNCGQAPKQMSADAGYFSEANMVYAMNQGIEAFIATERKRHAAEEPPVCGRAPRVQTLKQAMARKLATKRGKAAYAKRKVTVEPVFGQIKEVRGFRRFLLRTLEKVRGEWALMALTHNLLKLHRAAG
jgi:transposase